jgi:hypothetical protein
MVGETFCFDFMVICRGSGSSRFLQNRHRNNIKSHLHWIKYSSTQNYPGCAVAQLVEALRYKPEGRGLDFQLGH